MARRSGESRRRALVFNFAQTPEGRSMLNSPMPDAARFSRMLPEAIAPQIVWSLKPD
jgi:hypothetical protein